MPRFPIITVGAAGVDMRQNPLFLETTRASSATNLTFDEATIKTRYDIEYRSLGISRQFQGSTYYSPSTGLSATSYSCGHTSLATVVSGAVYLTTFQQLFDGKSTKLDGGDKFKGDTYLFDAENYLVVVNADSDTFWSESGESLIRSKGLTHSGGE